MIPTYTLSELENAFHHEEEFSCDLGKIKDVKVKGRDGAVRGYNYITPIGRPNCEYFDRKTDNCKNVEANEIRRCHHFGHTSTYFAEERYPSGTYHPM